MSPGEQGFWIESGSNGVAIEGSSCDGLLGLQSTGGRVKMDKNHPDRFIVVAWSIRGGGGGAWHEWGCEMRVGGVLVPPWC